MSLDKVCYYEHLVKQQQKTFFVKKIFWLLNIVQGRAGDGQESFRKTLEYVLQTCCEFLIKTALA